MTPRLLAPLTCGLLLLATAALAQVQNNPIPSIDVVIQKKPAGHAVVGGQTGRDGLVRGPIRVETGEYEVSAVCPPRGTCPAWVRTNGRNISPDARGQFVFPVRSPSEVRVGASVLSPGPAGPRR